MPFMPTSSFPPPWHHFMCALVEEGTVILPGNMGRIVELYPADSARGSQERVYETARKRIDHRLPSRLECTFTCPTERDAIEFALTETPKMNQWYLVEPVEEVAEIFVTSQGLWATPNGLEPPYQDDDFTTVTNHYWTIPPTTNREILFPGKLKVVAALEPINDRVLKMVDAGRMTRTTDGWYLDGKLLRP